MQTVLPKIPLAHWVNAFVTWLSSFLEPVTGFIAHVLRVAMNGMVAGLEWVPWWLLIVIVCALAYYAGKWKMAIWTAIGLLLIYDLQLWNHMIITIVLVIMSALISVIIGLPLGIWSARSDKVYAVLAPILDLMQTMPSFVYLVPVLIFFNIGKVPAIFATVIFAMPPAIRLTRLGILQVPADLVEAARAFGTADNQLLWKVQVPLALPSIKAGINQTVMLSLSMVVIAAMIGAGGLGADVLNALETINVGQGFEAGLSIVIIAIILDRISQNFGNARRKRA
ncbi:proline/glycine betaine ABC transporter permease [Alicyclobacillus sp. SO9]|uniref:ABC transporter permease n=1 Tax=Alicyclobacillus sp. SO9 TaxID=2665646 RepID=UPI0018E872BD|nr:proline/glycine betaine ABC transporter permease [Alicyclobacillus sp. SO9]QQE78602.1 proline/glycine betaine ABC transporter permease [Alicyclobacillus sp. SO9]